MADDVLRSERGWLRPGTAKVPGSGNKKGESRRRVLGLREYCEKLCQREGYEFSSPVEALIYMGMTGIDPLESKINAMLGERSPFANSTVLFTDGNGGTVHAGGIICREDRILCLRYAAPYLHSKLSSVEITGEDGSPFMQKDRETARRMSEDPATRALLEKIAIESVAEEAE